MNKWGWYWEEYNPVALWRNGRKGKDSHLNKVPTLNICLPTWWSRTQLQERRAPLWEACAASRYTTLFDKWLLSDPRSSGCAFSVTPGHNMSAQRLHYRSTPRGSHERKDTEASWVLRKSTRCPNQSPAIFSPRLDKDVKYERVRWAGR